MAFGSYTVDSGMGDGRFGPVYLAHDAAGTPVVVRTFTQPFTERERMRLRQALDVLCDTPLDHPSIARPLAAGSEPDCLYLVHSLLPGTSAAELTPATRPALSDLVLQVTNVAGALDFAAAADIFHGALTPHDVIIGADGAGVSGVGLVQVLQHAGIPGYRAARADDVRALAVIVRDLLGEDDAGRLAPAFAGALSDDPDERPATALEFAAGLQQAVGGSAEPLPDEASTFDGLSSTPAFLLDVPFRYDDTPAPDLSMTFTEPPLAAPAGDEPRIEDESPVVLPSLSSLRTQPAQAPEPAPESPSRTPVDSPEVPWPVSDPFTSTEPPSSRPSPPSWMLAAAVALVLGLVAGFAGGVMVGRGGEGADDSPAPVADAGTGAVESGTDTDRTDSSAAPQGTAPPAAQAARPPSPPVATPPAVSAPVPPPAAARTPAARTPARAAAPARPAPAPRRTTAPARPASRTAAGGVAPNAAAAASATGIRVESRPAGAQVYVDGRAVGVTPLVVGDVTPGSHSVRMELPGHRQWTDTVTVAAGSRVRVGASLEPQ